MNTGEATGGQPMATRAGPRTCRALHLTVLVALLLSASEVRAAGSCGIVSLVEFCELAGVSLTADHLHKLIEMFPGEQASMADLQQGAASLGVPTVAVKATLDELVNDVRGPRLLHMKDPDHFAVMARASSDWVQVLDSGEVLAVPRTEVQERYTGHALITVQEDLPHGPQLRLDEFYYSFGTADIGQNIEHAFAVTNTGDQELIIRPGSRGCGPPPAFLTDETVAPGASTEILLKFAAFSGNVRLVAKLLTNDLTQPVAYVSLEGKVPYDVRIEPDWLFCSGRKDGMRATSVTVTGPVGVELTDATTERGLFDVAIGEARIVREEQKAWPLQLLYKPGHMVGDFEDRLIIHTTHAKRPRVEAPIWGHIKTDLRVAPLSAFFGFVEQGQKAERQITIESCSGAKIVVRNASSDHARVRVTSVQPHEGRWLATVSVDTSEQDVVDGKVTITTDVPGEQTIEVPVHAHILPRK